MKAASVMLPSSIINKKTQKRPAEPESTVCTGPQVVEREESESDGESDDFFGFKSSAAGPSAAAPAEMDVLPAPAARIYDDEVAPGPSRPPPTAEEAMSQAELEARLLGKKNITNQVRCRRK